MRVGFLALARETFDIPFAETTAAAALESLGSVPDCHVTGDGALATDLDTVRASTNGLRAANVEAIVVFQATFADSTLITAVAEQAKVPLVLWATPEERNGRRLRLNSLCGINLAAYVLARADVDYRWVYREPGDPAAVDELSRSLREEQPQAPAGTPPVARQVTDSPLQGTTIGVVGTRPDGFEPCDYDVDDMFSRFGVEIDAVGLDDWFGAATSVPDVSVSDVRASLDSAMDGLDEVDQTSLDRSLRLYAGLSDLTAHRQWSGVATRCWPECFTEYGGAACAGNSLLTSAGTPGCCEADVNGVLTALVLQDLAGTPPLVADLVDLDRSTNTAVFWHCGLAPHETAGARPRATVHSNRNQPLLNEFPLKPGRVTIARVSRSRHRPGLLIGGGEMLEAPLAFSGTSGVARLDTKVDDALTTIMGGGLEHHYGIVYGDHAPGLRAFAVATGLEVIEL